WRNAEDADANAVNINLHASQLQRQRTIVGIRGQAVGRRGQRVIGEVGALDRNDGAGSDDRRVASAGQRRAAGGRGERGRAGGGLRDGGHVVGYGGRGGDGGSGGCRDRHIVADVAGAARY